MLNESNRLLIREQISRAEAEAAERRMALLAEASTLLAESFDYESALVSVAQLTVPEIADWCVVDLVDDDRVLRRLTIAQGEPGRKGPEREIGRRFGRDLKATCGPWAVIASGSAEIYPAPDEVFPDPADARAGAGGHVNESANGRPATADSAATPGAGGAAFEIFRRMGFESYLCVPISLRGRVLGVMSFVLSERGQRYRLSDVLFAEDLARRSGLAIENARLYRAAQESNRAKDEFLATLSHELRTPLTSILGWAELLRAQGMDAETATRGLDAILRNTILQTRLIDDLLDVSRIIRGKLRLDIRPVSLVPIIEAVVETLGPAAQAKEIAVETRIAARPNPFPGDPDRLQQVVWNLLSNAIKFTPPGGLVRVELLETASHLTIRVSDTGQGISPDFLPHVFERFRQGFTDGVSSQGLGLGLAIVRHLVELHGGAVRAESAGEGKGSRFEVELPRRPFAPVLADPQRSLSPSELASSESPSLHGLSLLVVDDDSDARDLLSVILRHYGAHVTVADSAEDALAVLARVQPDVLLSDIGMPGEDGFALIRKVRALDASRGGEIPAAALTAYASDEDARRALAAGFQVHISKPVEPARLAAKVAELAAGSPPGNGPREGQPT